MAITQSGCVHASGWTLMGLGTHAVCRDDATRAVRDDTAQRKIDDATLMLDSHD